MPGFAGVCEERESKGGFEGTGEHAMSGQPSAHRVACSEGVLALTEVFVCAGQDDFHFADPTANDVGKAHGVGERKGTSGDGIRHGSRARVGRVTTRRPRSRAGGAGSRRRIAEQ